jgi:hypothetical protein
MFTDANKQYKRLLKYKQVKKLDYTIYKVWVALYMQTNSRCWVVKGGMIAKVKEMSEKICSIDSFIVRILK